MRALGAQGVETLEQRATNRLKATIEAERDLGDQDKVTVSRASERSGALQLGD